MKKCFFVGHRDTNDNIYENLKETIKKHIVEYGVTEFYVGHYGNFDRLATKAISGLKMQYPYIKLILLLPYHPEENKIDISDSFDLSYYPDGMENVPRRAAIVKANRYMIDNVDYLIVNVKYSASNTAKLFEYALKKQNIGKLHIYNINNN